MLPAYFSYYKGKRVFVTGHTGFKGSWLIYCLNLAGAEIKGYALAPENEALFNLVQPYLTANSIIADIRDKRKLEYELLSFQPDFIFHLAAQPLVLRSYEIPAETFEINVTGTANLLECAKNLTSKCTIIVITTDKVYLNKEQNILYREDDKLGGYDPYSASKACTEFVVDAFRNSFFHPVEYSRHQKAIASARAGNVIGGGDWNKDRIIPDIIRSLLKNKAIFVRSPSAIRPWQFILEPISGYLLLGHLLDIEPSLFSKAYNFGPLPADHLEVKELVETVIRNWGYGEWFTAAKDQPHETGLLKLDISQAKMELGWEPKLSASQAIEWTVNWYKISPEKKVEYLNNQINEYFNL